jgi:hypothetical protein
MASLRDMKSIKILSECADLIVQGVPTIVIAPVDGKQIAAAMIPMEMESRAATSTTVMLMLAAIVRISAENLITATIAAPAPITARTTAAVTRAMTTAATMKRFSRQLTMTAAFINY